MLLMSVENCELDSASDCFQVQKLSESIHDSYKLGSFSDGSSPCLYSNHNAFCLK